MIIYAIDPGTEMSALVEYDSTQRAVREHFTAPNDQVMAFLYTESRGNNTDTLVIEEIESMGMAVGRETFKTVWWSGRMYEIWCGPKDMMPRRQVKLHICGTSRANDSNIRQAIYDVFGGKLRAVGSKKMPGPLFGLKGHEYAALALALTYSGHGAI